MKLVISCDRHGTATSLLKGVFCAATFALMYYYLFFEGIPLSASLSVSLWVSDAT